jgi:uncharacterized membrane protein YcaP (DUF421 family)
MDAVLRAVVVYVVLLAIFRLAGKRSLSEASTFDLVLTLIISESIQQALIDTDNSLTNALLLVLTLVGFDILLAHLKQRVPLVARVLDGLPIVLVERGVPQRDRMRRERVDDADLRSAAREQHGLENLEQVEHVVLEESGVLTVIPRRQEA